MPAESAGFSFWPCGFSVLSKYCVYVVVYNGGLFWFSECFRMSAGSSF